MAIAMMKMIESWVVSRMVRDGFQVSCETVKCLHKCLEKSKERCTSRRKLTVESLEYMFNSEP